MSRQPDEEYIVGRCAVPDEHPGWRLQQPACLTFYSGDAECLGGRPQASLTMRPLESRPLGSCPRVHFSSSSESLSRLPENR